MHVLNEIILNKKREINRKKKLISSKTLKEKAENARFSKRDFKNSLLFPKVGKIAVIGEIKLASPSIGILGTENEIKEIIPLYEKGGVDAISIITEKDFFKGDLKFIELVKQITSLPILAKDFIVDSFQLYEAKLAGADAVLLVAKIIDKKKLQELVKTAFDIGLDPIVEVNNQEELDNALLTSAYFIAVNARDLSNFEIDLNKACELGKKIPDDRIFLGFSGIKSSKEIKQYKMAGARGVLVGTSLMRAKNIDKFIKELKVHES